MKRIYKAPQVRVVQIQTAQMLAGSIKEIDGNGGIGYGGGGSGPARADSGTFWDDEEE